MKKGVKVEISRADALFLRQTYTKVIRNMQASVKAWGADSPSAAVFKRHLRRAERIREAVNKGLRK